MDAIGTLTELFAKFPGIGPRQARRFVLYLVHLDDASIRRFLSAVARVREETARCPECHRLFETKGQKICALCADPSRDRSTLLVAAKDVDIETVEKSGAYRGLYALLGPWLLARLAKEKEVKEVILGFAATPEGDTLARDAREMIAETAQKRGIAVSTLGRGFSTGTELEYSDAETLGAALKNRRS